MIGIVDYGVGNLFSLSSSLSAIYAAPQDLLRRRRLIQKYNRAELLAEDDDRAYTVIEKAIFYSAFIIRKLIDCKGKVSDEVDKYKFHLIFQLHLHIYKLFVFHEIL